MDDLSGLNWSSNSNNTSRAPASSQSQPSKPINLAFNSISSGYSTPLSAQSSGAFSNNTKPKIGSKPTTPANDSFSSLLASSSTPKPQSNLTLQERQRQLLEEKARQASLQSKRSDNPQDAQFWNSLDNPSSRTASPFAIPPPSSRGRSPLSQPVSSAKNEKEEDILAAFNADAKVDASSHFPPPQEAQIPYDNNDDDDPFGLGSMPKSQTRPPVQQEAQADDDDFLGMLGKPVSEIPPKPKPAPAPAPVTRAIEPSPDAFDEPVPPRTSTPRDKSVAELVDMGFPADSAARALKQTKNGMNVQEAVGILLNQAHQEATERSKGRSRPPIDDGEPVIRRGSPAWAQDRDSRPSSRPRRDDSRTPNSEKDVSQYAQDIGSSLFKSANSLWKTGQKKVQKAVADFSQDSDPSQPKWMREAARAQAQGNPRMEDEEMGSSRQRNGEASSRQTNDANRTNEAMLLEGGQGPPRRTHIPNSAPARRGSPMETYQGERRTGMPSREASPWAAESRRPPEFEKKPTSKLTRQENEEQSAQAYISPARRKKASQPPPQPSSDSRQTAIPLHPNNPFAPQSTPIQQQKTPVRKSTPLEIRPRAPPRTIPPLNPSALSTSTTHRNAGTQSFKRGDYSAAHTSYTSALTPLPPTHPLTIILLTNRSLTALKTGDPKSAIADADAALTTIGPNKGLAETIDAADGTPPKDMRDFYSKALTRKAEALEHLEKWPAALSVWKEAVESGVGGAIAMQGRQRCEKAATPKPARPATTTPASASSSSSSSARPKPRPQPKAQPARSAISGYDSASVARLRAANAAASQADDEKFALTDAVDARLVAWKGSKADNLRALLGSLDTILWAEAGWKKVGMNELVLPNRVKVVYMKAIAKVHPDKVPQSATTEQKMISASVFSTLNEAWDKFRTENGL